MRRRKKLILIVTVVTLMFALFGCGRTKNKQGPDGPGSTQPHREITVTFENDVVCADVWILPQTGENLETTLWGKATVGSLGAGETAEIRLTEDDSAQAWLVRIIDEDHAFYSADDLKLADGFRIVFRSDDTRFEAVLEVLDREGTPVSASEAFTGMLGAG